MRPEDGAHHQDGQTRKLPQSKSKMGTERFPRQTERVSTNAFSCFDKTRLSDELPNGSLRELEHLSHRSYGVNRDVVCQMPPEAGHPPYIAARLKKPAHGMNDALRRWWNIVDKALCNFGMVPTRADRCCYVLYSTQTRERTWNQKYSARWHRTNNISIESRARSEGDATFQKMLDHKAGSPATRILWQEP